MSRFGAPLSGWWRRVASILIDYIVLWIPYGIVVAILNQSNQGVAHTFKCNIFGTHAICTSHAGAPFWVGLLNFVIYLAVFGGYFGMMNGIGNGQTLGNMALGIAVRDAGDGSAIGVLRGMLRWFVRSLLYVMLFIPGVISDLFPLWDPENQTLADKAASSVVVRVR
jgi:uncharacterized RDD family membrane protein YckC